MSIVIAIKKDDTVYFGADTQRTAGLSKQNCLCESNFKVTKYKNGVLLAHVGSVRTSFQLYIQEHLFDGVEKQGLSKEFLVKNVVPEFKRISKEKSCMDKTQKTVRSSLIVAYKDKMYKICSDFGVIDCDMAVVGSGTDHAIPYLVSEKTDDVNAKMYMALQSASKFDVAVSAPYIFINTQNLSYEIVD